MNISHIKKLAIIFALLVFAVMVPSLSHAANVEVAILKTGEDYNVYLKGMESKNFQFAFTNDNLSESEASSNLKFIKNWDDTNGVNVACLEKGVVNMSKPIYLWVKDGESLSSTQIKVSDVLSDQDMSKIERITKRINTKINQVTTESEANGVKKKITIGELDITDNKDAEYKYQLIKIDGTESENVKNLNKSIDELKNNYSSMGMYEKITLSNKINEEYNKVLASATLENVKNMVIYQPEESKDGDKYLVILQKSITGTIENDIQILTCTRKDDKETAVEKKVVKTTSALPVTFDSIVLISVLAVLAIIILAVIIRMKKLSAKNNEK